MKTKALLTVLLLAALQAQAGSWEDENGVTHFYKDAPPPNLDKPQSYGFDHANEAAAQSKLNSDRQRWVKEDQIRAEEEKQKREQRLKEMAVQAEINQARWQREQAAAAQEQARQMEINNRIQAQRLLRPW